MAPGLAWLCPPEQVDPEVTRQPGLFLSQCLLRRDGTGAREQLPPASTPLVSMRSTPHPTPFPFPNFHVGEKTRDPWPSEFGFLQMALLRYSSRLNRTPLCTSTTLSLSIYPLTDAQAGSVAWLL